MEHYSDKEILRILEMVQSSKRMAPCDGSGGFGPPNKGLLGWIKCPGCPNCYHKNET